MQNVLTAAVAGKIGYIKLGDVDYVYIHATGSDWVTGTIDVKVCPEILPDPSDGTYTEYGTAGTALQIAANGDQTLNIGGCMLSFTVASSNGVSVSLWVSGANILEVTPAA